MNFDKWTEELTKNWKQSQEQYWSKISEQYVTANSTSASDIPNISEGLEQWWAMMSPQMPKQADDAMQQAIQMGKSFTEFAEQFASTKDESKNALDSWLDNMEKGFKAWSGLAPKGDANFVPFTPGNVAIPDWQAFVGKLNAKSQENLQTMSDLAEKYREAMNAYTSAFSVQGLDSVQSLREKMTLMEKTGQNFKSLREVYELWVDVSEDIYGKFTTSKEFQDIYGNLVNSFVALKCGIDSAVETQMQSLNIPTPEAQDDLREKLQQAKRENEALRKEIKALKGQASVKKAPTKKTATAKPKASTKPTTAKSKATKPAAKPVAAKPEVKKVAVVAKPDDLTKIKGIGQVLNKALASVGIETFQQVADLSPKRVKELDEKFDLKGRLTRDEWIKQAAAFAAKS